MSTTDPYGHSACTKDGKEKRQCFSTDSGRVGESDKAGHERRDEQCMRGAQTMTATGQQTTTFRPLPPEGEGFSLTPFVAAGFAGDYEDTPAAFGLALGYGANERVSLEAEFGLEPSGTQGDFLQADTSVWTLSGSVLYHFAQPQFTPYLALGLGVMGSDPDISDELLPDESDSTTTFAYNWGGGVKSALNEHVGLRGDFRYINGSDLAPDHWRVYGGLMFRNIGR